MKRCEVCKNAAQHLVSMTWKDGTWKRICIYCADDLVEWRDAQKKKGAA